MNVRHIGFALVVCLAGSTSALAQGGHAHSSDRPHGAHPAHGPGHACPDPAACERLHRLLHGSWTGTMKSSKGVSGDLSLSFVPDSARAPMISMHAAHALRAGAASNVALIGDRLTWTQVVLGAPCQANAVLDAVTPDAPATLKGTMECAEDEITFAVQRKTE